MSEGGEARNHEDEVEVVARALHRKDMSTGRARYDWDEMQQGYRDDCLRHARVALDAVRRSQQGEGHEAGIEWAEERALRAIADTSRWDVPTEDRDADARAAIAAMKSEGVLLSRVSSPVSGTEPDTARLCHACGHEWKRHDPEDGRCDAHSAESGVLGPCRCGRDVAFTAEANARLSRKALDAR